MKKLLSLKFLSEIPKSFSHSHSNCYRNLQSLSTGPTNPIKTHLFTSSPSSHFSPTHHHQWQSSRIYGFFSNPFLLAKHFNSTAHMKGSIKTLLGPNPNSKVVFFRAQFPKVKFSSWSSSQHGSWRSWYRGLSTDNVVLGLILANAGVFLLWRIMDKRFMFDNFTISVSNFKSGHVHTLITNAFSHIELGHIVSNMIGLYFFGNNIGRVFGPEFLLKLYFAGAVVGSVFYLVHHAFLAKKEGTFSRHASMPGLGASGAVNAIMLLDIFLFPKATLYLEFFIPVPAMLLGVFLIGQDIFRMMEGDPGISGSAHLGGAAVAAVAWLRLRRGIRF